MQPEPADERNVLGGPLEPCGVDPVTGFYRDGHCTSGPEDLGSHTVCSVVSAEFLALQRELGNDLITPRPEYSFPGLKAGDRWCVVAIRWLQAYQAGTATGVVLAATNVRPWRSSRSRPCGSTPDQSATSAQNCSRCSTDQRQTVS